MTKRLRAAIESAIETPSVEAIQAIAEAYREERESLTLTAMRVEFLEERLIAGDTKKAAARALQAHDPRVGLGTAETLAYTAFSGMYQNPLRRRKPEESLPAPTIREPIAVAKVDAEEDLL